MKPLFFWSTTFLEPDFLNQISRITFLEPLFYTFLEKWLQIKWSHESLLTKLDILYPVAFPLTTALILKTSVLLSITTTTVKHNTQSNWMVGKKTFVLSLQAYWEKKLKFFKKNGLFPLKSYFINNEFKIELIHLFLLKYVFA